jgi:hypothetical protein
MYVNAPVKPQYFRENQNEHHCHEYLRFVDVCAYTLRYTNVNPISSTSRSCKLELTESPTIPIAYPAANPVKPHASPAAR